MSPRVYQQYLQVQAPAAWMVGVYLARTCDVHCLAEHDMTYGAATVGSTCGLPLAVLWVFAEGFASMNVGAIAG